MEFATPGAAAGAEGTAVKKRKHADEGITLDDMGGIICAGAGATGPPIYRVELVSP